MPPWHIDKTVGIQQFKNDASLTDRQIDTIVKWVDAGAPLGNTRDMPPPVKWPNEDRWEFASQFGPPDLVIKSPACTMPAQSQDAWYKPIVDTGLTEQRWVRAIEIRPATKKGRRITHHALARLQQDEAAIRVKTSADNADTGPAGCSWSGRSASRARCCARTPASSCCRDRRSSGTSTITPSVKTITDAVELAIYFYPKGETPKYRTLLGSFQAIAGGKAQPRHPAEFGVRDAGFPRDEASRHASRTSSRTCTCAARRCRWKRFCPMARRSMLSYVEQFPVQLARQLRLRRRCGADPAEGHDPAVHGVARQHDREQGTIPIRISGSAGASARWTRWRTRG